MWPLDERFYLKIHLIGSVATLLVATVVTLICLFPAFLPEIYKLIIDARISYFIPYLLFIALGESIFSLWYFNGIKKRDDKRNRGQ
jgi:hypothetical protein